MKKVLLLLCQGAELLEAAAFYDVLGWSGANAGEPVQVTTAAPRSPLTCTFGLRLLPDLLVDQVNPADFDALAIPGGFEAFGFYTDAYSESVTRLIQNFAHQNKPIASICVGALPIAHAGLLAGKKATTYHLMDGNRRAQLAAFGVQITDAPIVRDGNITTSTSPATAIDVALSLLADLTGRENADRIRQLMGFAGK